MTQPVASLLCRLLGEELVTLGFFIDLLQREQQLLTSGDVEQLVTLVEDKSRLAEQLAHHARLRSSVLVDAAVPTEKPGFERWLEQQIAQYPQDSAAAELRKHWQSLLNQAVEARSLNETNGQLIGNRMVHNQQALNALLAATQQAALYGPDGQPRHIGGGRLFGAA